MAQEEARERASENTVRVPPAALAARVREALDAAGVDERSADGATRAMMHASLVGVDSHGARLVLYYTRAVREGSINPRPAPKVERRGAAAAMLDADDGLGHAAAYDAMALAGELAREAGVGAVGVRRSSHLGAAGAYARAAAEAGLVGIAVSNADSLVAPHAGLKPFHGTNPIAVGAPSGGPRPWLLDMATSSIPFNRVHLYGTLGRPLPPGVAADASGDPTIDPHAAAMLVPLGGADFGFKGAALAGVVTVLAAMLTGSTLDGDMALMQTPEGLEAPRGLGAFFLAIDPARFGGADAFRAAMERYLQALRAVPARPGEQVLAAGDREWRVAEERGRDGVPIDFETAAFLGLRPPA